MFSKPYVTRASNLSRFNFVFQTLFRYIPTLHKPLTNLTAIFLGTSGRPPRTSIRTSCSLLQRTPLLMPPAQIARNALAQAQTQALITTNHL